MFETKPPLLNSYTAPARLRPRTVSTELEFLPPRPSVAPRRGSLQAIMSKSLVVTYAWGSLAFAEPDVERDWRNYTRLMFSRRVASVLKSVAALLLAMTLVMTGVTVYCFATLSGASGEEQHALGDALRWAVALGVHVLVCAGMLLAYRGPAHYALPTTRHSLESEPAAEASWRVRIAYAVLSSWFGIWLGTLAYLNIATKFSRASAAVADAPYGASLDAAVPELLEHARASNNSTALLALISLSCFMRAFRTAASPERLAYELCVLGGLLLLVSTLVAWCVQPLELPLAAQPAVMWTNLTWVILAMVTDIAMCRGTEKVRRRLFHLQRVMETSNTHLMRENQMLMSGSAGGAGDFLDLESPVQKVLNMLRTMQADSMLIEWQAAIEAAITKLSRAKLHDLFLPSAVALPSAKSESRRERGAHVETEMVEQILFDQIHHHDQDERSSEKDARKSHQALDDGVLVEERRKDVLRGITKSRLAQEAGKVRLALKLRSAGCDAELSGSAPLAARASPLGTPSGAAPDADGEEATRNGSPTPALIDSRLAMLEGEMPEWGCGTTSIFGLHEAFGPDLLFVLLEHAFRQFHLFEHFAIDAQKLQSLSSAIVGGYREHPYHNYIHGCDVTHGTYWVLRQKLKLGVAAKARKTTKGGAEPPPELAVWEAIPEYAVLAALLGAAIHDIGHDGFNNAFHVATGSSLAVLYNDQSCLENMHASTGLALFREAKLDVLEHLSADQRKKLRTLIIDMIMGTDLANHFEQLSQIQTKTADGAEGLQLVGEKSDLALFMGNVVHAADLGSTANTPAVYFTWMQRVFREFFFQGEEEARLGLPRTPFMDRSSASIPKAQLGFLKYLCQPLFDAIVAVVPALSVATNCMAQNIAMLNELDEKKIDTEQIMGARNLQALLASSRAPAQAPAASAMDC